MDMLAEEGCLAISFSSPDGGMVRRAPACPPRQPRLAHLPAIWGAGKPACPPPFNLHRQTLARRSPTAWSRPRATKAAPT
jgi:hypothetical protein